MLLPVLPPTQPYLPINRFVLSKRQLRIKMSPSLSTYFVFITQRLVFEIFENRGILKH